MCSDGIKSFVIVLASIFTSLKETNVPKLISFDIYLLIKFDKLKTTLPTRKEKTSLAAYFLCLHKCVG